MKTIRNVFAVLILSANFANAQTIDKTLLKLIDHNLSIKNPNLVLVCNEYLLIFNP